MKSADVFYGAIEFWNGTTYGFIRPDRGGDDVFFHVSELPEGEVVRRGDRVAFDIDHDKYKPAKLRAVQITLVDGEDKAPQKEKSLPSVEGVGASALADGLMSWVREQ